MLSILN